MRKLLPVLIMALCLMNSSAFAAAGVNNYENTTTFATAVNPSGPPVCATGLYYDAATKTYSCPAVPAYQLNPGCNPPGVATSQEMTGINPDGTPICKTRVVGTCPAGQGVNGYDSTGNPICVVIAKPVVVPKCAAKDHVTEGGGNFVCATPLSTLVSVSMSTMSKSYGTNSNGVLATPAQGGWCLSSLAHPAGELGRPPANDGNGEWGVPNGAPVGYELNIFCVHNDYCSTHGNSYGEAINVSGGKMSMVCIKR